jgi:hypothetical protein
MVDQKILITGTAGNIGSLLRQTLVQPGRHLRLLDTAPQTALQPGENAEIITTSFLDRDALEKACQDVSVVIHLGGLSTGGYAWQEYLEVNINGTFVVLEAARKAGVPRVIYASSHHAVGFHPIDTGVTIPDYATARPDSYYGVSKVASEGLCSLYHDRHGLDVICLRIGSYRERPTDQRALWNWLSPGDCTRLFEAAITVPSPGFRVVWGISANTRAVLSLDEARSIGYDPHDNAEEYAGEIVDSPESDDPRVRGFLGGTYTATAFDSTPN